MEQANIDACANDPTHIVDPVIRKAHMSIIPRVKGALWVDETVPLSLLIAGILLTGGLIKLMYVLHLVRTCSRRTLKQELLNVVSPMAWCNISLYFPSHFPI